MRAGSIKRVTLELGGKAAAILLDDAPIEESLRNDPAALVLQQRPGVHRARAGSWRRAIAYDEVVEAAVAIAA